MAEAGNTYPYPSTLNIANFVTIKLSDSSNNYSIWKAQMLCLLESQELVGFIDGTIQPPSEKVTEGYCFRRINKGSVGLLANQDYLKWKRSDRLVKGWILGSLAEEMLHKVAEKVSARDVYLELNEICCPISQLHESEGSSQTMPRAPKYRSFVWEYFEVIEDDEEKRTARCKQCGVVINCHAKIYGTCGLRRHIKRCVERHQNLERQLRI